VQPRLFEASHEEEDAHPASATDLSEATGSEDEDLAAESEPTVLRAFVNDEIANTIDLLPYAPTYPSIDEYRQFLRERLPYNSETTRQRQANYIVNRFFSDQRTHRLLLFFLKQNTARQSLNEVIFYHLLKAEKLAARVAEDFVWPALPVGRVDREEMRSFVLGILPHLSKSSQQNTLRALVTAYDLLGIGQLNQGTLYVRTRYGTLDSFVYLLLAECPKPGIYAFTTLENGPMHRWLLWDRQWIRRQLYNLRDLGILTKVSEIDTVRQFSLALAQNDALAHYFAIDETARLALREEPISVAEPPTTS
jgi:DNA repair protein RadC